MDVRLAWDEVAAAQLGSDQAKAFEMTLVSEGLFRRLVESLATENHLDAFMFGALANERVKKHKGYRSLLQCWTAQWKQASLDVSRLYLRRGHARSRRRLAPTNQGIIDERVQMRPWPGSIGLRRSSFGLCAGTASRMPCGMWSNS